MVGDGSTPANRRRLTRAERAVTPELLLSAAVGYLETARLIAREEGRKLNTSESIYWPAFFLVAAHVLELCLKTVVLSETNDQALLKWIGHDLTRALDEARARGFNDLDQDLRAVVETLREPHMDGLFRYLPGEGAIEVPLYGPLLEVLDRLVHATFRFAADSLPS